MTDDPVVRTTMVEGEEAMVAPDPGFVDRMEAAGILKNVKRRRVDGATLYEFDWAEGFGPEAARKAAEEDER